MIVHPECRFEVCQKADALGSTERLIALVEQAPEGQMFAVGTEIHLVNRMARRFAAEGKRVITLDDTGCLCTTMYRITPAASVLGAGESGRGAGGEPHPGAAEREALGQGGAGPDAGNAPAVGPAARSSLAEDSWYPRSPAGPERRPTSPGANPDLCRFPT